MAKLMRKVPDGGWGWMVVFGAALGNLGNQSLVSVFGLAYGKAIMKTSSGFEGVALVMNINSMVTNFSGLLTGPILKSFSPRLVTAVGVLLTTSGLILSGFATTLWHFIVTYSVFTGLGLGLIMPASFMAINSYFDRRKGQAVGLAMAGTGIGQTCMPLVVHTLLDNFDFTGTVAIMGAIALHGLIGALLFEPVERHLRTVVEVDSEEISLLENENGNMKSYNGHLDDTHGRQHDTAKPNAEVQSNEGGAKNSPLKRISAALDLHLLRDARFAHIIIGLSVVYTSSIAFSMLFPFHLMQIGLSQADAALCMSALSTADIAARLTIPCLARRARVGYRTTFLIGALVLAASRTVLVFQTSLAATLAASVLCGYVRAATVINQNLTVAEYCDGGGKQLPSALGLNMVAKGVFVLSLGQFFASLRASNGSYVSCILIQSVFLAAVAASWGGEMLVLRLRRWRHDIGAQSASA